MSMRVYDVVLYGASGFTGRQTAQYFARHAPPGLRWAIAGRNREKLAAVAAESSPHPDILVADSAGPAAIDAIVSQTRVLLTTAGPFALYAGSLVDACVRFQTHYVDITGETPWVRSLIDRYHARAAADGTRIIPCCGFDSVPSDLGCFLMAKHCRETLGAPCRQITAYFAMRGGVNGGTLASGFAMYDTGLAAKLRDPFLLDPERPHSAAEIERNRDPAGAHYDDGVGAWVAPFIMGVINTRVVRRSCALSGIDFEYQEYMKCGGPLAWMTAAGISTGLALYAGSMELRSVRNLLRTMLPKPGSGPSTAAMDGGWFRCEFAATTADGRKVSGLVSGQGDPGNRVTVQCLCEAALALAVDSGALPGGPQYGGLLTPSTGLGDVLVERLRRRGMALTVNT